MGLFSSGNIRKAAKEPAHAVSRAAHLLSLRTTRALVPRRLAPPAVLTLFLTYRCNLKCRMCGQNRLFSTYGKAELSPDDYAELLGEFRVLKPSICLFGGEPLLYPRFDELVELIDSLGFRQHLITNGTLLDRLDERTIARLDRITVSINGPEDVHNRIANVSDAFERAMAGIERARAVRARRGSRRPLVYSLVTVTQDNFALLSDVACELARAGVDGVTFQHLSYITPDEQRVHEDLVRDSRFAASAAFTKGYVDTPKIDADVLWDQLERARATRGLDVFVFPDFTKAELEAYYSDRAFDMFGTRRCEFGWFEATVMPDGRLTTCMNIELGRLGSSGFMDAWRGEGWMQYRRFFAANTLPYCVRCCGLYRY